MIEMDKFTEAYLNIIKESAEDEDVFKETILKAGFEESQKFVYIKKMGDGASLQIGTDPSNELFFCFLNGRRKLSGRSST